MVTFRFVDELDAAGAGGLNHPSVGQGGGAGGADAGVPLEARGQGSGRCSVEHEGWSCLARKAT